MEAVEQFISVPKFGLTMTEDKQSTRSRLSGVTPKVMATINGEKVMVKSDSNYREPFIELLAYRLGTAIGLKVNRVKLIDCGDLLGLGRLASAHYWEDNFERTAAVHRYPLEHSDNIIVRKFFDAIINNDDRHDSNWGYVGNDMFLIDNGMSYTWQSFDEGEYEHAIINAITCPYALPYVESFCKLREDEIIDMVEYPNELEYNPFEESFFNNIVERLLAIQEYIREKIVENGGKAIWLM